MILTDGQLQDLLDKSLAALPPGPDWAVVLEGSIAEGFGNPSSDIDFLLIGRDGADLPTMPSLLFVDGRRVEIRTRSVRQLAEQFTALEAGAGRPGRLSEDLLNRCQRLLGSHPLRGHALVDEVKALLPAGRLREIAAGWWTHRARQSLRHAMALDCLGEGAEAADWARAGLVQAVKAWAAGRGETYLEPKWLSLQLDRAGRADVRDRYWALESAAPAGHDADADAVHGYLGECLAFAAALGVSGVAWHPERLTVERAARVTTWQTGERVHVIRGRRDVFALGERAGAVWRSLVLGTPLPAVLAGARRAGAADTGATDARASDAGAGAADTRTVNAGTADAGTADAGTADAGTADAEAADAGRLVAAFLRYGLVRLAWKGAGTVTPALPLAAPAGPVTPPPYSAPPLLSVRGAAVSGPDGIDLLPLPAERFAAATMALVWSNVVVENAREDLDGALRRGQWRVAELTSRRAVHAALRGLFSSHGVNPLPADTDLVRRLSLLPSLPGSVRGRAEDLLGRTIASAGQGERARTDLGDFVALVRDTAGADAFPSSFDSADTWRATLELGYDWLRIGTYLGAELPLEEARDLIVSNGVQPHQAA
ncbi:nucleotidyltransferase domain-containing protein [Streptomyces fagopyri]|uniref:nucleotidyltransferase domain-containing protein n=1 Tax=Streptomyces fagopyri TaxID=2662397 RepID=UPI00382E02C8